MGEDEIFWYSAVLVALYLRSREYPGELFRRDSGKTLRFLRSMPASDVGLKESLKSCGLWHASVRVSTPGLLDWAKHRVEDSEVVTCLQPEYPQRLLAVLGDAAPPVFWRSGPLPVGPSLSVCGSRRPPTEFGLFAKEVGAAVGESGRVLVTGGAVGCDLLAESSAVVSGGHAIRLLPCGTAHSMSAPGVGRLSLVDPYDPFSTASAMERNFLIHCSSDQSVVAHSRFKEGGTWHGLQEAVRRKVSQLYVPAFTQEPWAKALLALGARPLESPAELFLAETALNGRLYVG